VSEWSKEAVLKFYASCPKGHFTYKIELLCWLLKTYFVAKIPTGNNPS